jgi:hypothetical protein
VAVAAPDYLAYFNQLALGEPQRIVTDSDLDWGHDVDRLIADLKQRRVGRLYIAVHTSADLRRHDLPPFEVLYPNQPAIGWVAISEQMKAFYCAGYRWLDAYQPVTRIGSSIRLYYVPGSYVPLPEPEELVQFDWNAPLPCPPETPAPPDLIPHLLSGVVPFSLKGQGAVSSPARMGQGHALGLGPHAGTAFAAAEEGIAE